MHERANVPLGVCGIDEIKRFQAILPGYQIHVMSHDHFNAMIYTGQEADHKIYLYMHDNHYDVITSMAAFFKLISVLNVIQVIKKKKNTLVI